MISSRLWNQIHIKNHFWIYGFRVEIWDYHEQCWCLCASVNIAIKLFSFYLLFIFSRKYSFFYSFLEEIANHCVIRKVNETSHFHVELIIIQFYNNKLLFSKWLNPSTSLITYQSYSNWVTSMPDKATNFTEITRKVKLFQNDAPIS
jgi:hypothetical protein